MRRIVWSLTAAILFCSFTLASAEEKTIGVWMSPGGPWGIWKKSYENDFPVQMIVKDLAELGITDIFFFEQCGRGGSFLHPTQVKHAVTDPRMKERDFLKELLDETVPHNIKVWLAWTTPDGKYPKTEIQGLNNPDLIKIYTDEIDEIAKNYGKYKNLAGIMWHEVDCSEYPDEHEDDVAEFSDFCLRRFGEKYDRDKMPQTDPDDKWWRRFHLYRIDVVNSLVAKTKEAAAKHGLKMYFCFYTPESFKGESWRWGYDVVALEKLCDNQWFSGYVVESGKPYQTIKGTFIDFGPSYQGQILPRNYSYAFHGRPVSYFEYRSPVYIEEMRRYYSGIKSFNEKYGDIYTGYLGKKEKEVSLFQGKQNLKNWLGLMAWWQGGESPAKIAVAVNPTPFVMKCPVAPAVEYDKKVRGMMVDLTSAVDIDGFIVGSQYALHPDNLLRYSLLIIPEDMGGGLSEEMAKSLREYIRKGGQVLVMSTPLKSGKPDLTEEADLTRELCGVEIGKARLPGYMKPTSDSIRLEGKKFWGAGIKQVTVHAGDVLVKEGITGCPLLVRNGTVYFSAMGYTPESAAYFSAIVKHIAQPPVSLLESDGIRILESARKGGVLCLSLWGKGKAALRVDAKGAGLSDGICRVKDIVTGKVLGDFSAETMGRGIPVEIKHVNQPFILVVGREQDVDVFKGIYPSEDVFEGMTEGVTMESPEVPLSIPDKKGIKIGVYHGGLGASGIVRALNKVEGINCYLLPRLDGEAFAKSQVVIIPQAGSTTFFNQAEKLVRSYVEEGGGVLLLHDAVGYRGHAPIFSDRCKAFTNPKLDTVRIAKAHPVTSGFSVGDTFVHAYADHVVMEDGAKGTVVAQDEKGQAVAVALEVGKGRAVLNGMATGYASKERGSFDGQEGEPTGGELTLLVNSIKWLAKGAEQP